MVTLNIIELGLASFTSLPQIWCVKNNLLNCNKKPQIIALSTTCKFKVSQFIQLIEISFVMH
jgi:hypothetical protein